MAKIRSSNERPFDLADHFGQEVHPVDQLVQREPRQRVLRQRIRKASRRLDAALGPRREAWLHLEADLAALAAWREETFFGLGYQHGVAAGRAEALTSTAGARALATALRDHAIQSGCPKAEALAALLEAAWALVTNPELARPHESTR